MASLGHIAVGMAAARLDNREPVAARVSPWVMLFWAALSFAPDADVIGFGFGIRYGDEWGHRGASHSLLFSLALGTAVGIIAPLFRRPALRTGILASLVLASHALLDTLTDGGLGCALFWPFDLTRYFAPWRPIPVSPIGLGYFSPYGMLVAATELAFFAPFFWYGLSRRSGAGIRAIAPWRIAVAGGAWLVPLWLALGSGALHDRVVGIVDDTEFAPGYSAAMLAGIEEGDTEAAVRAGLGEPLQRIDDGPGEMCWLYSRSPDNGYFRLRAVCFTGGRVSDVVSRWLRL